MHADTQQIQGFPSDFELDLDCACHGFDSARENAQRTVTIVLEHSPIMSQYGSRHDRAVPVPLGTRPELVLLHQRGVTRDVGKHDRRELPLASVRHCSRPLTPQAGGWDRERLRVVKAPALQCLR
jgi:hypothetical protein